MKKLLLSVIVTGISASLYAQAPTMDFESWTTMNNGTLAVPEEPTGWVTANQLVNPLSPGNSTSVTKATGADAHGGAAAMKITTVDVVNDPSGGQMPDPAGVAFAGKVQLSPIKLINGFPFTTRPTTCNFWYKYSPVAGDSASCGIVLTKWNGTTRDTIATGGVYITAASASYAMGTVAINYIPAFSSVFPDSMGLGFSATCIVTNTCGKVGSILWVDDVTFSGSNGIHEQPGTLGVSVYPNPATELVTITSDANEVVSASIVDLTGKTVVRTVAFDTMAQGKKIWKLNASSVSPGLYFYALHDKDGKTLRAGKLNIAR